jgi:hypothetical protein
MARADDILKDMLHLRATSGEKRAEAFNGIAYPLAPNNGFALPILFLQTMLILAPLPRRQNRRAVPLQ